ncbi:unnamed protein product [Owenia fusiformis]|uniref:Uncharacterized protein n=1 Tax=Owenia fusiformis TaxID=6347 RepID=A0A8J1XEN5_OWEFU|nr:unnamed protein product [Owenia fusiformis]
MTTLPRINAPRATPITVPDVAPHLTTYKMMTTFMTAPDIKESNSLKPRRREKTFISHQSPKSTYERMTTFTEPPSELYGVYPPRLTQSAEFSNIPKKVNPCKPVPPKKWTKSLETGDGHWHNHQRTSLMQQLEYFRYHSMYQKAFYGSPSEKEDYRKNTRLVLKQQMTDRQNRVKDFLKNKVSESEGAVEYDNKCLKEDADNFYKKFDYLKKFRDDNKLLMEEKWRFNRETTDLEKKYDNEQLKYNPINWSCTLK